MFGLWNTAAAIDEQFIITSGRFNVRVFAKGGYASNPIAVMPPGGGLTMIKSNFDVFGPISNRLTLVQFDYPGTGFFLPKLASWKEINDAVTDVVDAVLHRYRKHQVVMTAWASGGWLALNYTAHHQAKVSSCIVYGTPLHVSESLETGYQWIQNRTQNSIFSYFVASPSKSFLPGIQTATNGAVLEYYGGIKNCYYTDSCTLWVTDTLTELLSTKDYPVTKLLPILIFFQYYNFILYEDYKNISFHDFAVGEVPIHLFYGIFDKFNSAKNVVNNFNLWNISHKSLTFFNHSAHVLVSEEPEVPRLDPNSTATKSLRIKVAARVFWITTGEAPASNIMSDLHLTTPGQTMAEYKQVEFTVLESYEKAEWLCNTSPESMTQCLQWMNNIPQILHQSGADVAHQLVVDKEKVFNRVLESTMQVIKESEDNRQRKEITALKHKLETQEVLLQQLRSTSIDTTAIDTARNEERQKFDSFASSQTKIIEVLNAQCLSQQNALATQARDLQEERALQQELKLEILALKQPNAKGDVGEKSVANILSDSMNLEIEMTGHTKGGYLDIFIPSQPGTKNIRIAVEIKNKERLKGDTDIAKFKEQAFSGIKTDLFDAALFISLERRLPHKHAEIDSTCLEMHTESSFMPVMLVGPSSGNSLTQEEILSHLQDLVHIAGIAKNVRSLEQIPSRSDDTAFFDELRDFFCKQIDITGQLAIKMEEAKKITNEQKILLWNMFAAAHKLKPDIEHPLREAVDEIVALRRKAQLNSRPFNLRDVVKSHPTRKRAIDCLGMSVIDAIVTHRSQSITEEDGS